MRVLVTGAAGMLGGAVCPEFERAGYEVVKTDINLIEPSIGRLDIRVEADIRRWMEQSKPDIVLHLAAETDVDLSEKDPEHAKATNGIGTLQVARACAEYGATIVYISTAGVFDGRKEAPYTEDDPAYPIMVYGQTKLDGEQFVRENVKNHFICRAGWMIGGGIRDKKFVSKILDQVSSGAKKIYAVTDKYGTPTFTNDFAKNLLALIKTEHYGLYHMACSGTGTRYDVAEHILKELGRADIELVSVDSKFFSETYPAPRPRSEMMENANLKRIGLQLMRDWRSALSDYLHTADQIGKMLLT